MPTVVVRHLATLTLIVFTIWSWTAPVALLRAQRAAVGLAVAGGLLLVAALLPGRTPSRYGDDYSWALATALIIAGGAAISLTQPSAVAIGAAVSPPTSGRLLAAALLGGGFGAITLLVAGVIFFMTLWPGSARDYERLIFRVHLPFLAVVALSFSLAIHALRAT